MRIHHIILLVLSALCSLSLSAREIDPLFGDTIDRTAEDFVTVSLCIADPTDPSQDYLGIAGHAFLRLQCPTFNLDYCFSYESEKIKGQLFDFLRGRLKMGMFSIATDEYLQDYRNWHRAVHEYTIHMPPAAKQRLWEAMDNHTAQERELTMDIVKFGCTNTLLKYVESAMSPYQIDYAPWPAKYTDHSALEIVLDAYSAYPWECLGIRIFLGKDLRKPTLPKRKVIVPTDLLEVWSAATYDGRPFITYHEDLVNGSPTVPKKTIITPTLVGIVLLAVILVLALFIFLKRSNKSAE